MPPADKYFALGANHYSIGKCLETKVDIFRGDSRI